MSTFNADDFMNETIEGEMDTKVVAVPEGEYSAQIETVKARPVNTKNGERIICDITWNVLSDEVKEITGREKPTVRQSIWLDIDEATNKLDTAKGKNINLGRLRAALDLNSGSKAFSLPQLIGGIATITVKHRPNPDDPESPYAEVSAVGRA